MSYNSALPPWVKFISSMTSTVPAMIEEAYLAPLGSPHGTTTQSLLAVFMWISGISNKLIRTYTLVSSHSLNPALTHGNNHQLSTAGSSRIMVGPPSLLAWTTIRLALVEKRNTCSQQHLRTTPSAQSKNHCTRPGTTPREKTPWDFDK